MRSFNHAPAPRLTAEDERSPIWDVADPDGRVLASKISFIALRARIDAGLLPLAALVAHAGENEWRPLCDLLTPSRTARITSLWYVTRRGAPIVGPVDSERIERGLSAHRVPTDSVVCRVGDDRWRLIGEVPEFAARVAEIAFDGELTLVADAEARVHAAPPPPSPRFTS